MEDKLREMIKEMNPLSLAETMELVAATEEDSEESKEIKGFLKKFTKLKVKEAKEMKKELEGLNIVKLKGEHIIKIIDILPEDAADLNKILVDVSLDEDENKKILEVVKKYK